ncbi:MAG TPA: efflux RND transporter permease subunit [Bryobacteraceae bacterium]|nr:efflux RND transporter permease subunit [Bryobacteraceae bacterium]
MQKLAEICVRRPVFATMLILALTIIGAFAFMTLGVDRFPRIEFPMVSVVTYNPGSTPEQIETEITDIIEGSVNTVAGIDELRSTSVEGMSQVAIMFDLSKDVDVATQEVRQKVDLILRRLPDTADPPIIQKLDPDSAPILMYAISSPLPVVKLTDIVDKRIKDRIESVNGVGEAVIFGGRLREVQISVDPERLRAYNMSILEVATALQAQNLELPGGRVDEGARELTVRALGRIGSPEEFNDLVIRGSGRQPVRIRDVGYAVDGGAEPRSSGRLDGAGSVVLAIRKQSGTNTVAVSDAVKERMDEIRKSLPPDFKLQLMRDDSEFINAALGSIEEHLILGSILAAIVVFLFLWNFRSTIIAAIAIPTSIIAAFGLMAAFNFTLNQMTMLSLTLMVGIVIDDAIVVLENIYRFVEEKGMNPFEAAIEGTREIGLAVMATTLSLLAVFVPIGFMGGMVGRFMSSFGLTSAAAIAVSLLVSFTLTPMLAARWIKPVPKDAAGHAHTAKESRFYRPIDRAYTRMLHWSMAHRWTIVFICLGVSLSTVPLFMLAGVNFLPEDDDSQFEVTVRAPEGTSLASTQSVLERMARDIREQVPAVRNTLTIAGFGAQQVVNNGTIFVRLRPAGERDENQSELIARARQLMKSYPKEITVSVQAVPAIRSGGRSAAIQYVITGPDLQKLGEYSGRLLEHMKQDPNIADADRSFLPGKPEVRLSIDRKRAGDLGVSVSSIAQSLNLLMAGNDVTKYNEGKDQYDVVLRAHKEFRRDPSDLLRMTVPSTSGMPVLLSNVVTMTESAGPASIDRLRRERQVTMYANVPPGGSQTEALASMQAFVANMGMETGYQGVLTGQSKELARTGYYFGLAFLLSFIFMYMILAAQFESFIHPVTILLTLPLAIPFALLSTFLAGQKLNVFSALGILLLFGVVKKNAILQVDHTNELRSQGLSRYDAIILGNRNRLRPILMTTIALVAGMLPLCLGSGAGAATNRSIGILVVGGQSMCLLLTLLAVPVFYSLFDDMAESTIWGRLGERLTTMRGAVTRRFVRTGAAS